MTETASNTILRKLLRRPPVIAALAVIALTCLMAIFAYVLAPDNTPYANRMIVEFGARPAGFEKELLYVPKSVHASQPGLFSSLVNGTPSDFTYVPENGYSFDGSDIVLRHYIDEGMEDTLRYPLRSLLPASEQNKTIAVQQAYIRQHNIHTHKYYLGTDRYGRDILSRLLVGSRISISVGLVAVLLSLTIGIVLGSLAGYFGGITDNVVMWMINILWAIPTLLLVFAITLTIGKGFWEIFIAIGLTMWVSAARLIRGQVLVLREMEYVTAAKALGTGHMRIIFRHILPNIAGPVMVVATSNFAAAVLTEASLSFLGIGVQPPQPSWGLMIKEHYNFLLAGRPFLAIVPGLAIMLLVYAFNILGNALRDVLDVREK
ncbi:ABC transporter permease [Chitinophagaceae bacterium MMS25-I14]